MLDLLKTQTTKALLLATALLSLLVLGSPTATLAQGGKGAFDQLAADQCQCQSGGVCTCEDCQCDAKVAFTAAKAKAAKATKAKTAKVTKTKKATHTRSSGCAGNSGGCEGSAEPASYSRRSYAAPRPVRALFGGFRARCRGGNCN